MDSNLTPTSKEVRKAKNNNPDSYNSQTPAWNLKYLDLDCEWSFAKADTETLLSDVLVRLQEFESQTWQEIIGASSGKVRGTRSHNVSVGDLIRKAQRRLDKINLSDVDELFSLRLDSKKRVWGIRNGRVFEIIWFDEHHAICPSNKR